MSPPDLLQTALLLGLYVALAGLYGLAYAIARLGTAPLLRGHRGSPPADLGALRDLLLRVSRLADDLPEVTELDLNPVIARPDGAYVVDARIKVRPYLAHDPFLRKLR